MAGYVTVGHNTVKTNNSSEDERYFIVGRDEDKTSVMVKQIDSGKSVLFSAFGPDSRIETRFAISGRDMQLKTIFFDNSEISTTMEEKNFRESQIAKAILRFANEEKLNIVTDVPLARKIFDEEIIKEEIREVKTILRSNSLD